MVDPAEGPSPDDGGVFNKLLQLLVGATCCAPAPRSRAAPPFPAGAAVFCAAGRDEALYQHQVRSQREKQTGADQGVAMSAHVSLGAREEEEEEDSAEAKAREELRSMENLVASLQDIRADWKVRVAAMQTLVGRFEILGPSSPSHIIDLISAFCKHLAVQVHSPSLPVASERYRQWSEP